MGHPHFQLPTFARFLRDPGVHPQPVARITGELAASAALATGEEVETVVDELAQVGHKVALDHAETLRLLTGKVEGSA